MWMYGRAAAVSEKGTMTADKNIRDKVWKPRYGLLPLSYHAKRCTKVLKEEYAIREDLTDLMRAPSRVWRALNQPLPFETTTAKQLERFFCWTRFQDKRSRRNSGRGFYETRSLVTLWNTLTSLTGILRFPGTRQPFDCSRRTWKVLKEGWSLQGEELPWMYVLVFLVFRLASTYLVWKAMCTGSQCSLSFWLPELRQPDEWQRF